MKKLIIILFAIILFANCVNLSQKNSQNIENIDVQFFEIPVSKAYTITTKGGVIIDIQENTFISNNKTIQLEIQEILTRIDLIRSQISTITKNGQLLETGGMLNITTTSDAKINPDAPITIKVPSKGLDINMKLYEAVNTDGKATWSLISDLENQSLFNNIALGKKLFSDKCAACHSKDLSEDATGPKLGNITAYRNKQWLRDFTRNSSRMIENGDSLARCNWAMWSPTVMSSFEDLTDDEIDNIYRFIENETLLNGLDTIQSRDCDKAIKLQKQRDSINAIINYSQFYIYNISMFNFYNIDKLAITSDMDFRKVNPFFVKTNIEAESVFLIFENKNIAISFFPYKENWMMFLTEPNQKIDLPYGEPIKLVAISKDGKQVAILKTTIQDTNEHTLKLKPLEGNYDTFLKGL